MRGMAPLRSLEQLSGVPWTYQRATLARLPAAQAAVLAEGDALWDASAQRRSNAWLRGRSGSARRYKPGSREALLLFSDRAGARVLRFPLFWRFRGLLQPLLEQVRRISTVPWTLLSPPAFVDNSSAARMRTHTIERMTWSAVPWQAHHAGMFSPVR